MNDRAVGDAIAGDWSFGFGFNVVDDGGVILGGLFEGKKYNHFHMPFTINAEYFYDSQWSFTTTLSFNKYMEGKIVDRRGTILKDEEPGFFAIDLGAKFYFRDIFNDYKFEPYVFSGFGFTSIGGHKIDPYKSEVPGAVTVDTDGKWNIPATSNLTFNVGLGTNYWINKNWGVNVNAAAKWGFKGKKYEDIISNYTQFSFGGFYCLKKL